MPARVMAICSRPKWAAAITELGNFQVKVLTAAFSARELVGMGSRGVARQA